MTRPWPLILVLLSFTVLSVAQGSFNAWIGTWDLDVDGLAHQLFVRDSDRTCNTNPWCALDLAYRDNNGNNHPARIITMSNPDSLTFEVRVDEHTTQLYEAYRFTRDHNRLAGVTKIGGVARGFSGSRR
jgi:hypothetical protein